MLGKRSRPTAIAKLGEALRSVGVSDSTTSPRSPLDCRTQSPRGSKNYDKLGGVGLGIVVALENNSGYGGGEILAKYAMCGQFSTRSNPIPVKYSSATSYKHDHDHDLHIGEDEMIVEEEEEEEEEFTYVTCHGPNKSMTTRVYYEGGEHARRINQKLAVFKISSPATLFDDRCGSDSDFLSSCHLCRKTLHGKDIYMYRGEKAFCSTECRQKQIGIEERKEVCRSEASRSSKVSTSPYSSYTSRSQIFSTGIVAI